MSLKRQRSPESASESTAHQPSSRTLLTTSSQSPDTNSDHLIFKSSTIHDRSSDFIAIFSPTQPITTASTKALQSYRTFSSASHKVLAWRKPSAQTKISLATSASNHQKVTYTTGSDDDGEKYAGGRLERLLNTMEVIGTVVVARWYGGILLGPVRFTHIEDVAREAIISWQRSVSEDGMGEKRRKVDDNNNAVPILSSIQNTALNGEDEMELKSRIAKSLVDRDRNILVLRNLLTEKQQQQDSKTDKKDDVAPVASESVSTPGTISSPEKPGPDYTSMPLQRLRQLEKARDASIAWILKELDKLESTGKMKEQ